MNFLCKLLFCGYFSALAVSVFAQNTSVPDLMRSKLVTAQFKAGDITCTVLLDSRRQRDASILVSPENPALLAKLPPNYTVESDNTVLMAQYNKEIILFDTGNGVAARGQLMQSLKEARVSPTKITAIFITHMHGDHIGGLLIDGKPAFPNAVVYLPKEEAAYWLPENSADVSENLRGRLENGIRIFKTLKDAGQSVVFFTSGSDLSAYFGGGKIGFVSRPAFGHTPGHTVYVLTADAEKVLYWGDILHVIDPQLAFPDISASYDMNPAQSAKERKLLLDFAAKNHIIVSGTHTVFPSAFRIQRDGAAGFQKTVLQSP